MKNTRPSHGNRICQRCGIDTIFQEAGLPCFGETPHDFSPTYPTKPMKDEELRSSLISKLYHLYSHGEYSRGHDLDWKSANDEVEVIFKSARQSFAEEVIDLLKKEVKDINHQQSEWRQDFDNAYNAGVSDSISIIKSKL